MDIYKTIDIEIHETEHNVPKDQMKLVTLAAYFTD